MLPRLRPTFICQAVLIKLHPEATDAFGHRLLHSSNFVGARNDRGLGSHTLCAAGKLGDRRSGGRLCFLFSSRGGTRLAVAGGGRGGGAGARGRDCRIIGRCGGSETIGGKSPVGGPGTR